MHVEGPHVTSHPALESVAHQLGSWSGSQGPLVGTLITPRHIVGCAHRPLNVGATVKFRSHPSQVSATITQVDTVGDWRQDPGVDFCVATLDKDIPAEGGPQPMGLVSRAAQITPGMEMSVVGWPTTDPGLITCVGRLEYNPLIPLPAHPLPNAVWVHKWIPPEDRLPGDAVRLSMWDSGNPTFLEFPGARLLFGVHNMGGYSGVFGTDTTLHPHRLSIDLICHNSTGHRPWWCNETGQPDSDENNDGIYNYNDMLTYLETNYDVNRDGIMNFFDVLDFIARFERDNPGE